MKILPQPTRASTLKALAYMRDDPRLVQILAYLFDECVPAITHRLKLQRDDVTVRWLQGAAMVLDDLQDISVNAESLLAKALAQEGGKNHAWTD